MPARRARSAKQAIGQQGSDTGCGARLRCLAAAAERLGTARSVSDLHRQVLACAVESSGAQRVLVVQQSANGPLAVQFRLPRGEQAQGLLQAIGAWLQ